MSEKTGGGGHKQEYSEKDGKYISSLSEFSDAGLELDDADFDDELKDEDFDDVLKDEDFEDDSSLDSAPIKGSLLDDELFSTDGGIELDDADFITDHISEIISRTRQDINNYPESPKETLIAMASSLGLDKEKIKVASDQELEDLLIAINIVQKTNELISNNEELNSLKQIQFKDLWMEAVNPSDFEEKDKFGNFTLKLNYFKDVYSGADKEQKIKDLLRFKELGEQYKKIKNDILSLSKDANQILNKYYDLSAPYSPARKNNAVWITPDYITQHQSELGYTPGVLAASKKIFGPKANEVISYLQQNDNAALNAIINYTSSYSKINETLRGETYSGGKTFDFVDAVENMTRAIDQSTYDFDFWVQRGINQLRLNSGQIINYYTDKDSIEQLVGTTFEHPCFYSSGAAKGTGFASSNIILNTYCPIGTKAFYIDSVSHYKGTTENEMILQRGYSFKITKAEKVGNKIYLDVETILGSDENKFDHDALVKMS